VQALPFRALTMLPMHTLNSAPELTLDWQVLVQKL
jgi:hypothetical protein